MNEYLTAEIARATALEAQSLHGAYKKVETEEILAQILTASQAGRISLSTNCSDTIIAYRLRALGYNVKITSYQRDGDFMDINW